MRLGNEAFFPQGCPARDTLEEQVAPAELLAQVIVDPDDNSVGFVAGFSKSSAIWGLPRSDLLCETYDTGTPEAAALLELKANPQRREAVAEHMCNLIMFCPGLRADDEGNILCGSFNAKNLMEVILEEQDEAQ